MDLAIPDKKPECSQQMEQPCAPEEPETGQGLKETVEEIFVQDEDAEQTSLSSHHDTHKQEIDENEVSETQIFINEDIQKNRRLV